MSTTIPIGTGPLEPEAAVSPADRTAYGQLVSRLSDLEPRYGWGPDDLPSLSDADRALICRVRMQRVVDNLDMTDWVRAAGRCDALVHQYAVMSLGNACREAVFLDVERECEVRDEERVREGRQESAESALGVVGLFRDSHLG